MSSFRQDSLVQESRDHIREVVGDFRRVPADTTFAQGVEVLKAEGARLAGNHRPEAAATDPKAH
jgi:hypothetical protein